MLWDYRQFGIFTLVQDWLTLWHFKFSDLWMKTWWKKKRKENTLVWLEVSLRREDPMYCRGLITIWKQISTVRSFPDWWEFLFTTNAPLPPHTLWETALVCSSWLLCTSGSLDMLFPLFFKKKKNWSIIFIFYLFMVFPLFKSSSSTWPMAGSFSSFRLWLK